MVINLRRVFPLLLPLVCAAAVLAQQQSPGSPTPADRMLLDIVVTSKSGSLVSGLQQQDFTLLDNKARQTISSFEPVDGRKAPIEVVLVVDAINAEYQTVMFERDQINKFLHSEEGGLAHPTAFAFVTDTDTQVQNNFSTDGNALSVSLNQYAVGFRNVRRSAGVYGDEERFQFSLAALQKIAATVGSRPGRKIIVWFSPGWPLLSNPNFQIDTKEQQQLFAQIVDISAQLVDAHITLYSIDPLGTADTAFRDFYWQEFLKGISKPSQVQPGNLGLQVIASQSGGLALNSNNDVSALLRQSIADLGSYYELSFDPPHSDRANEYHHLEIRISKPGLTARTYQGYYSEP